MSLLGHRSCTHGIMLKVTGSGAMPGALTLLPTTVSAAAGAGPEGQQETAPLLRDELSLYPAAPLQQSRCVQPEAGQLEESVATLRKVLEPYTAWCRGTYSRIKPKVQSAVRFGNDAYSYLKDPPKDFYPRAGVIGFTGVLGLLLARRSRVKRLLYPAGLVTVSASLYYPEQAAAIAKATGDSVYDRAVRSYAAVEKMVKPEKSPDSDPKP